MLKTWQKLVLNQQCSVYREYQNLVLYWYRTNVCFGLSKMYDLHTLNYYTCRDLGTFQSFLCHETFCAVCFHAEIYSICIYSIPFLGFLSDLVFLKTICIMWTFQYFIGRDIFEVLHFQVTARFHGDLYRWWWQFLVFPYKNAFSIAFYGFLW